MLPCGTDGQTTTSEDRATQLLICEALSLAIKTIAELLDICMFWLNFRAMLFDIFQGFKKMEVDLGALKTVQQCSARFQVERRCKYLSFAHLGRAKVCLQRISQCTFTCSYLSVPNINISYIYIVYLHSFRISSKFQIPEFATYAMHLFACC